MRQPFPGKNPFTSIIILCALNRKKYKERVPFIFKGRVVFYFEDVSCHSFGWYRNIIRFLRWGIVNGLSSLWQLCPPWLRYRCSYRRKDSAKCHGLFYPCNVSLYRDSNPVCLCLCIFRNNKNIYTINQNKIMKY